MISIKKDFCSKLIEELGEDDYFITADLGYGVLDEIKAKLGDRFINVGVSEQVMISMASGLALDGKRVFVYTISSFYLRALEQIKLDLYGQKVENVILIGIGEVDEGYENFGLSHLLQRSEVELLKEYMDVFQVSEPITKFQLEIAINQTILIILPR